MSATAFAVAPERLRIRVHEVPDARGEVLALLDARMVARDRLAAAASAAIAREFPGCGVRVFDSGTSALLAGLRALGVAGKRVHVCTNACPSVVEAILSAGGEPVLVEAAKDGGLDADALVRSLLPRSAAVVQTHLYGRVAGSRDSVEAIAAARGIALVDDAAQAFGAGGQRTAGGSGTFGILSFGRTKPVPCWGGGAIVARSPEFLERIPTPARTQAASYRAIVERRTDEALRRTIPSLAGALRSATMPNHDVVQKLLGETGVASHLAPAELDGWTLALLARRMHRFGERKRQAVDNARSLHAVLSPISTLEIGPEPSDGLGPFPIVLRSGDRIALSAHLAAAGVETSWYHYPLHLLAPYRQFAAPGMREDDRWARRLLLPCRDLSADQALFVAGAVRAFF